MAFRVLNYHETRDDDPNLHGYKVIYNGQDYELFYDKESLREVYFLSHFYHYFMSCRVDFTTISHYYTNNYTPDGVQYIKRYENGVNDQNYYLGPCTCYCDSKTNPRTYTACLDPIEVNVKKLRNDLITFLDKFYALGLDKHFCPEEPKSVKK